MKHHTESQPKCMTKIMGSTLIEHQINILRQTNIRKIAIVTGYLSTVVKNYLAHETGIDFFHNNDWANTNMVSSLQTAKTWLTESPCIVSYSDILYNSEPISKLIDTTDDIAISYDPQWETLWRARFNDPLSDAETFILNSNNYLNEIGQRPTHTQQIQGQYMGLLKFSPTGWACVEKYLSDLSLIQIKKLDMTSLLQGLIKKNYSIKAAPIQSRWLELDNPSDLVFYQQISEKLTLTEFFQGK